MVSPPFIVEQVDAVRLKQDADFHHT